MQVEDTSQQDAPTPAAPLASAPPPAPPHPRLDAATSAHLKGIVAPLVLLTLSLRVARLIERGELAGVLGLLDVFKSDLLLLAGFGLTSTAMMTLLRPYKRAQRACLAIMLPLGLLWACMELAAFNFYLVTGSSLDFALIHYAFAQNDETWSLARDSTPVLVLIAPVLFLIVAVRMLVRKLKGAPQPPLTKRHARVALVALPLGLLLAALSVLGPLREPDVTFARSALVHVGITLTEELRVGVNDNAPLRFRPQQLTLRPRQDTPQRNIVVIILESTRAKSVTPYAPELQTTPYLKQLTEQGLWAERAYAIVPHTSKAIVGILCGIEPNLTLPITESAPGGIPARCLAKLMREQGYRTAFFQTATERFEGRRQLVANMGFEDFIPGEDLPTKGFQKANYFGVEDDAMLAPSRQWLEQDKDKPFLLTYLTVTPHHQYLAPRRYGRHNFAPTNPLNLYLNSVHYLDHFVKNVIEQTKALGLYEDTIFVVVGDHGEGFKEHGRSQHDNTIYEEGVRVPLIFHDPQALTAKAVPQLSNQLDILPTALHMAGWTPRGELRGQDLHTLSEERVMFAHCWYANHCIASIDGPIKTIHHFGKRPDEVFNLAQDPDETIDLAEQTEDLSERRAAMLRWRDRIRNAYTQHYDLQARQLISRKPHSDIAQPLDLKFGELVKLHGYELTPAGPVPPGQQLTLTLYYEALANKPEGWKISLQGQTSEGKWVNLDHEALGGVHPLSKWRQGEHLKDIHTFAVPRELKPGETFTIYHGLYRTVGPKQYERAPLRGEAERDKYERAKLLTITAGAPTQPSAQTSSP